MSDSDCEMTVDDQEMGILPDNWNGRKSPAPTPGAITSAALLVHMMIDRNLEPTRLAPSAVGGVGVTRRLGERLVYVECYNHGKVYAIFSDDQSEGETHRVRPDRIGVEQFLGLMEAYLDG